ncbi:fimbrillin-like protein [Bacteroides zoogleoformans]|uniref:Fimbrillin family protein n=1 Tax=Bacteroides zoogleoformans TaxID=28119 RepID=A0ABM6T5N9_9BACE|nr:fimbrillin family protein [Bacteroides zoogleoformans]AVM51925.1 fimbrillin family protein [Bacteroides zoogleoformans]TWJ11059.1 fimbrillin-like protein [Bacteroides zoogleoformans]
MKKKILFAAALAAVALTSCNNDNEQAQSQTKPEYITVSTSIDNLTRVSTTGNASRFDEGDKISVYAWTGTADEVAATNLVVNNSVNELKGGKWLPTPLMKWVDMATPHFFLSLYPARNVADFKADPVTVDPAKQMESDLLVAVNTGQGKAGLKATDNPVQLRFDHMMSKLVLELTYRNEFDGTPAVASVSTEAKNEGTIDYLKGVITLGGTAETFGLQAQKANEVYASVIMPQEVQKFTIAIDGKNYVYTHPAPLALVKGKKQTVKLIVGRNRIELDQVVINDWGAAADITGGEAVD